MIAALICVVSVAALLQFCVSYCRSVIAASCRVALSEQLREIAGVSNSTVGADEFGRLRSLVQLCPERADDRTEISAVGKYYAFLNVLRKATKSIVPRLAEWADGELPELQLLHRRRAGPPHRLQSRAALGAVCESRLSLEKLHGLTRRARIRQFVIPGLHLSQA